MRRERGAKEWVIASKAKIEPIQALEKPPTLSPEVPRKIQAAQPPLEGRLLPTIYLQWQRGKAPMLAVKVMVHDPNHLAEMVDLDSMNQPSKEDSIMQESTHMTSPSIHNTYMFSSAVMPEKDATLEVVSESSRVHKCPVRPKESTEGK